MECYSDFWPAETGRFLRRYRSGSTPFLALLEERARCRLGRLKNRPQLPYGPASQWRSVIHAWAKSRVTGPSVCVCVSVCVCGCVCAWVVFMCVRVCVFSEANVFLPHCFLCILFPSPRRRGDCFNKQKVENYHLRRATRVLSLQNMLRNLPRALKVLEDKILNWNFAVFFKIAILV